MDAPFRGIANAWVASNSIHEEEGEGNLTIHPDDFIQVLRTIPPENKNNESSIAWAYNETTGSIGYVQLKYLDGIEDTEDIPMLPTPTSPTVLSNPQSLSRGSPPPLHHHPTRAQEANTTQRLIAGSVLADNLSRAQLATTVSTLLRIVRAHKKSMNELHVELHQKEAYAKEMFVVEQEHSSQQFLRVHEKNQVLHSTIEQQQEMISDLKTKLQKYKSRLCRTRTSVSAVHSTRVINSPAQIAADKTAQSMKGFLILLKQYETKNAATREKDVAEQLLWNEIDKFQLFYSRFEMEMLSKQKRIDGLTKEVDNFNARLISTVSTLQEHNEIRVAELNKVLAITKTEADHHREAYVTACQRNVLQKNAAKKKFRRASFVLEGL